MTETVVEKVARTRKEQGLPPKITEAMFYDKVAAGIVDAERREVKEAA